MVLVNYPSPSLSFSTSEFSLSLSSSIVPFLSLEPVVMDAVSASSTSLNRPDIWYHLHHDSDVIPVLMGLAQPQTPRRQRTRKTLTGCSLPRTSNTNNRCRYPTRALRILSTLQIELTMDDFRTFLSMNKGNMCEVGVGNTRVDDNEGGE